MFTGFSILKIYKKNIGRQYIYVNIFQQKYFWPFFMYFEIYFNEFNFLAFEMKSHFKISTSIKKKHLLFLFPACHVTINQQRTVNMQM